MEEESSDCSSSLSNLICQEDATHLAGDGGDDEDEDHHGVVVSMQQPSGSISTEKEDEYIELLVSKECSFDAPTSGGPSSEATVVDWLKHYRSGSIRWILRMKACFGFGAQTAYLAVTYFDRFLARRIIDEGKAWALRLLSVACLSLAAKMEELRPPALPEFRIGDFHFDSTTVQRMELLVLNTLDWRMSSVTPFSYLGYFASKLGCDIGVKDVVSIATMFVFRAIQAMNPVDYRPSTIAAAAIFAASGQALSKNSIESRISTVLLPETFETEHVFACYRLMIQGSDEGMMKASMALISSDLFENYKTTVNSSSSFTASNYKRRRLL